MTSSCCSHWGLMDSVQEVWTRSCVRDSSLTVSNLWRMNFTFSYMSLWSEVSNVLTVTSGCFRNTPSDFMFNIFTSSNCAKTDKNEWKPGKLQIKDLTENNYLLTRRALTPYVHQWYEKEALFISINHKCLYAEFNYLPDAFRPAITNQLINFQQLMK